MTRATTVPLRLELATWQPKCLPSLLPSIKAAGGKQCGKREGGREGEKGGDPTLSPVGKSRALGEGPGKARRAKSSW